MQGTKEWLIEWFQKHGREGSSVVSFRGSDNYFEQGWIDSFSFIALISELETHFNIRFGNDEFHNRAFSTIDGLTEIINHKLHATK